GHLAGPPGWATWLGHAPRAPRPPLRPVRIRDDLAGRLRWSSLQWLFAPGVMPLYTPLSGSWLNLAEAVERILAQRARPRPPPQTAAQLITWLEATVPGWNAAPTPFGWAGPRRERRVRARQRRLGGAAAALAEHQRIAA